MAWQDLVFAIGGLILGAALIPSLTSSDKPHVRTSLVTGVILAIYVFAYFSLDLLFAAIVTTLTASMWFVLAYQKYRLKP